MTLRNGGLGPFLLLYGAYVATLHAVDGPWRRWSRGGSVDQWTWTHVLWGAIGAYAGLDWKQMLALGVSNELLERRIAVARPDLLWGQKESLENRVVDVLASNAGLWLGKQLKESGRS